MYIFVLELESECSPSPRFVDTYDVTVYFVSKGIVNWGVPWSLGRSYAGRL